MAKSKKPTAATFPAVAILTLESITQLSAADACREFITKAGAAQGAFVEMGKLHHHISQTLKKGQTIYGELRKLLGNSTASNKRVDSCISNASYASRVLEALVIPGHLPEAEFDQLAFAECLAITRVMGEKSENRLSAEDVVLVFKESENPRADLDSLYRTGYTVAEMAEVEKREAEAEAQRQAQFEQQRQEAERQRQEQQQAAADAAAAAALAAANPPPVVPQTGETETPAPGVTSETPVPATPPAPLSVVNNEAPETLVNEDDTLNDWKATATELGDYFKDFSPEAQEDAFAHFSGLLRDMAELMGKHTSQPVALPESSVELAAAA